MSLHVEAPFVKNFTIFIFCFFLRPRNKLYSRNFRSFRRVRKHCKKCQAKTSKALENQLICGVKALPAHVGGNQVFYLKKNWINLTSWILSRIRNLVSQSHGENPYIKNIRNLFWIEKLNFIKKLPILRGGAKTTVRFG